MTRLCVPSRLTAAVLCAWSTLAAAAPGVAESSGFGVASRRRTPDAERLLEADLRAPAYRLWVTGGFGQDRSERAAWVVRAPAGVAWRPWPWDRRDLQARWHGPAPVGAVAIVHTHPAVVDPRPSFTDRDTAARLGIAVYTVSRSGIWKAGADGALTRVGDERWWAGCGGGDSCRESVPVPLALASAGNCGDGETTAVPLRIPE